VIATGHSPDALARLSDLGAEHTIDFTADADIVQDALAVHRRRRDRHRPRLPFRQAHRNRHHGYRLQQPGGQARPHAIAGGAAGPPTTVPFSVHATSCPFRHRRTRGSWA